MRLDIASSLSAFSLGGGGHTRLSIMSSVDDFITEARSGGSAEEGMSLNKRGLHFVEINKNVT
jgi:hypothetical protein